MTYLEEVRIHWRYLAAACLGLGSGYMLNLYISNAFAPHLLSEFGWSKSQFALLGGSILVSIIVLPIVGRICDIVGVRPMIAFGVTATPLIFVAFSRINGNFVDFFLLSVLQFAVGTTTASLVYSRLIAEHFHRARGLALALSACTAPATVPFAFAFYPLSSTCTAGAPGTWRSPWQRPLAGAWRFFFYRASESPQRFECPRKDDRRAITLRFCAATPSVESRSACCYVI